MNAQQIDRLDDLTLEIDNNLSILNSAVKDSENLEICSLGSFVENIYSNSKQIRDIFIDEVQ